MCHWFSYYSKVNHEYFKLNNTKNVHTQKVPMTVTFQGPVFTAGLVFYVTNSRCAVQFVTSPCTSNYVAKSGAVHICSAQWSASQWRNAYVPSAPSAVHTHPPSGSPFHGLIFWRENGITGVPRLIIDFMRPRTLYSQQQRILVCTLVLCIMSHDSAIIGETNFWNFLYDFMNQHRSMKITASSAQLYSSTIFSKKTW